MPGAEAGAARWSPERSWRPPTPCAKNSPPLATRAPGGGAGAGRAQCWGVGLFSTFPLKPELLLSTLRGPGVLNPRAPSGPC